MLWEHESPENDEIEGRANSEYRNHSENDGVFCTTERKSVPFRADAALLPGQVFAVGTDPRLLHPVRGEHANVGFRDDRIAVLAGGHTCTWGKTRITLASSSDLIFSERCWKRVCRDSGACAPLWPSFTVLMRNAETSRGARDEWMRGGVSGAPRRTFGSWLGSTAETSLSSDGPRNRSP